MWTILLLALIACSPNAPTPPAPQNPPGPHNPAASPSTPATGAVRAGRDAGRVALEEAQNAATALGGSLKKRLLGAMQAEGPKGAVTACADEAQGMTALATAGSRARAGRSALRLRNPANGDAPAWVTTWLKAQGERSAEGVPGVNQTHQDGDVMVARVLKPIAIEGPCLTCHGDPAAIPKDVRAILAERYPADQATGYALGDLRGALWAEARVPIDSP